MAARIADADDWPLIVGARIQRYHRSGKPVRGGKAMVRRVYTDSKGREVIDYEELETLKQGTMLVSQVRVLRSDGTTDGEKRYKANRYEAALLSKAVQKKRGRRI